jgi:hypothetical protein
MRFPPLSEKTFATLLAMLYGMFYLATWQQWHFIDFVTLIMHEAGHPLFLVFGETISILGGTLMQFLVPIVLVMYFVRSEQLWSAAIITYWLGFSLINSGIYIADAQVQLLPLIGGEHDWTLLCSQWGIWGACPAIGHLVVSVGQGVVLFACFWSWYTLWQEDRDVKLRVFSSAEYNS